jgi:hypothetical protein
VLDRHVYHVTIPPTPELVMLMLADPGWLIITTIRHPEERAHLYQRIVPDHGAYTIPDSTLQDVADTLLESWTGWPGWTAVRIWRETLDTWQWVDGQALRTGTDSLGLPPDRATTLAYSLLAERHQNDKDHGDRWRRDLTGRPRDVIRREAADTTQDTADWQAMANISRGLRT